MCVCLCVPVCVCGCVRANACACVYACAYLCVRVWVCMHKCMCMCACLCVPASACVGVYVHMHVHVCTLVRTCVCVCGYVRAMFTQKNVHAPRPAFWQGCPLPGLLQLRHYCKTSPRAANGLQQKERVQSGCRANPCKSMQIHANPCKSMSLYWPAAKRTRVELL